jgi:hypothetical protein
VTQPKLDKQEAMVKRLTSRLTSIICKVNDFQVVIFCMAYVLRRILEQFGDDDDRNLCVAIVRGDPMQGLKMTPQWAKHIQGEA